jgi:hypothetical protein
MFKPAFQDLETFSFSGFGSVWFSFGSGSVLFFVRIWIGLVLRLDLDSVWIFWMIGIAGFKRMIGLIRVFRNWAGFSEEVGLARLLIQRCTGNRGFKNLFDQHAFSSDESKNYPIKPRLPVLGLREYSASGRDHPYVPYR